VKSIDDVQAVEKLIQALNERDLELLHDQFHEDAVLEYPQSGERIVGGENRRAMFAAVPRRPTLTPRRIVARGELAVAETTADYGDGVDWRAVFMCELREGRIARATAYWAQPLDAAAWRAAWVERVDG
jgi:ketosteroid isomerase-like protein